MLRISLMLLTIIALLVYGIYKQTEVNQLETELATLKTENGKYKKHISVTEDKLNTLKGRLGYLSVETESLRSDLIFMKANPCSWSIPETEDFLHQVQSGIADAKMESE